MKLSLIDIVIIIVYLASVTIIGILFKKIAEKNKQSYMLGGNRLPWYAGIVQCFRHVRYIGNHVAGYTDVHLWSEEYLDSLAMAHIQSDFSYGLFIGLASPFKCDYRRGMDEDPFR